MTQPRLFISFILILISSLLSATDTVPIQDTIKLELQHVEGRWIEANKNSEDKRNIYVFRPEYTFHKAIDNDDVLVFNITGKFELSNDSIKVYYQDFSRPNVRKPRVRTMIFRVIALSDDELNINITEYNKTQFIRLRRQN